MVNVGTAIGYLDLDTSKFESGVKRGLESIKSIVTESDTVSGKLTTLGTGMAQVGSTLTKGVTVPLAALGAGAVATSAKFESSMSQVQATMGITKDSVSKLNGESVNTMDSLGNLAKEMGSKTAFSASQCADALNYLALAGYDTQQMADTLPTVLNLAAAGSIDLASASDMVTDAMSALGLEAKDADKMVDQMAKTASRSNTSVAQLGEGLLTIGATGKTVAGGTTELNTALGILANNGIKGAEGGTHLRNILLSLQSPTDDATEALNKLGVKAYDSEGNMRPLNDILQDFNEKMKDMTTEEKQNIMTKIFNKTDMGAINALLDNSGEAWNKLSKEIENSRGAAQQMSDTQLDNLSGQLTILKSGIEGLMISIGDILLPVVKDVVSLVQRATNFLNNLTDAQKEQIVKIAEIVAAIGPVLLIVGKVISFVGTIITTIQKVKTALSSLFTLLSANPFVLIIAAIAALVAAFIYLWNHCESFRNFWIDLWENIKSFFSAAVDVIKSGIDSIIEFFTGTLPEAISSFAEAIVSFFTETIPEAISSFVDMIVSFFTETIPEAFNSFVELLGSIVESIVTFFDELPYKIGYALGYLVESIILWCQDMYNTVTTKIPEIINAVVTFFSELPGKVWQWLVNTISRVVSWASQMYQNATTAASQFINAVVTFLSQLPGKVWNFLSQVISKVVSWGSDIVGKARTAISNFVNAVITTVTSLPGKFAAIIQQIPGKVTAIGGQMASAGRAILNSLWEGMKSIADGIVSWVSGIASKIGSFFSGIISGANAAKDAASSVTASGSHANGLDYVPYDGYIARLHKGERVLTAGEASKDRSGTSYNITINSPEKVDPYEANRIFAKQVRRFESGFA